MDLSLLIKEILKMNDFFSENIEDGISRREVVERRLKVVFNF